MVKASPKKEGKLLKKIFYVAALMGENGQFIRHDQGTRVDLQEKALPS